MIVINDNIKRYYVLDGLKTQKEKLKRNYEGRNHKRNSIIDCDK